MPGRPSPAPRTGRPSLPDMLLKPGSRGPEVLYLQQALARLGWRHNDPEGVFGRSTESALYHFQASQHLVADSIYGPKTRAALQRALTAASRRRPTSSQRPSSPHGRQGRRA